MQEANLIFATVSKSVESDSNNPVAAAVKNPKMVNLHFGHARLTLPKNCGRKTLWWSCWTTQAATSPCSQDSCWRRPHKQLWQPWSLCYLGFLSLFCCQQAVTSQDGQLAVCQGGLAKHLRLVLFRRYHFVIPRGIGKCHSHPVWESRLIHPTGWINIEHCPLDSIRKSRFSSLHCNALALVQNDLYTLTRSV